MAERLRHAVTLLVAFATLDDGERAREEHVVSADRPAVPALDLPGLTGRTDAFGPEVEGEDEVARSGRFTRAAATAPGSIRTASPASPASAGIAAAAAPAASDRRSAPAPAAASPDHAPVPAPACAPHPHRRTVAVERTERRHGMAPARPQPCLSPTTSASAAARRAKAAREAGARSGQLLPQRHTSHR